MQSLEAPDVDLMLAAGPYFVNRSGDLAFGSPTRCCLLATPMGMCVLSKQCRRPCPYTITSEYTSRYWQPDVASRPSAASWDAAVEGAAREFSHLPYK